MTFAVIGVDSGERRTRYSSILNDGGNRSVKAPLSSLTPQAQERWSNLRPDARLRHRAIRAIDKTTGTLRRFDQDDRRQIEGLRSGGNLDHRFLVSILDPVRILVRRDDDLPTHFAGKHVGLESTVGIGHHVVVLSKRAVLYTHRRAGDGRAGALGLDPSADASRPLERHCHVGRFSRINLELLRNPGRSASDWST